MALALKDSLFRDARNPVWVFANETLRFLDVNEAACQRYGYSREEFLSMTLFDIRTAQEGEHLKLWRTSTGRTWEHFSKAGEIILAEVLTFPFDPDEPDGATLALIIDVTER